MPIEGCPSGRLINVIHVQDDGTAVGYNADSEDDWTLYYIPIENYRVIEEKESNPAITQEMR